MPSGSPNNSATTEGAGASDPADGAAQDDAGRAAARKEARLVRRLQKGDEDAFSELVLLYQNRVFGLVFRMIGNRQEAEDIAQEVFLTVHRAVGTYRGEGRFQTWLFRIATNTCRNRMKYLKGRSYHRSSPVEESPQAADPTRTGPSLQSHVPGPEAAAEGFRLEEAVARELAALDEDHRVLIVLRDVQGLSYQDIMRITGLQEGTLKSRLHRARVALKERLAPYMG